MTHLALRVSVILAVTFGALMAEDQDAKWRADMKAGSAALEAGESAKARELFTAAEQFAMTLPADDVRRAMTTTALGNLELNAGNDKKAEQLFLQARECFLKQGMQGKPEFGQLLADLGSVSVDQGRWLEGESLFRQSITIFHNNHMDSEFHNTVTMSHLGALYAAQARFNDALPLLEKALDAQTKGLPSTLSALLYTLHAIGGLYSTENHYDKAESYLQHAWELSRTLPDGHPFIADSASHLGSLYFLEGKPERAERLLNVALNIYEHAPEGPGVRVGPVLTTLARVDLAQKHYAMGEQKMKRVIDIYERSYPRGHALIAIAQVDLAQIYNDEKRFEEAKPLLESGVAILRATYTQMHPNLVASIFEEAKMRAGLRENQEADARFREAIAGYEATVGTEDAKLATMLHTYAVFLKSVQRGSEAKPLEARAKAIFAFHR